MPLEALGRTPKAAAVARLGRGLKPGLVGFIAFSPRPSWFQRGLIAATILGSSLGAHVFQT